MGNIHQVTELEGRKPRGFNVEHITRVTGYFSKVSGWNKGKVAELVDRHRTGAIFTPPNYFGWYNPSS